MIQNVRFFSVDGNHQNCSIQSSQRERHLAMAQSSVNQANSSTGTGGTKVPPTNASYEAASTSGGSAASHTIKQFTASNVTNIVTNVTAQPSTGDDGKPGLPGGVIALLLGLLVLGIAVFCLILYLKKTGKLYRMIPFKPLLQDRRSSTSSSRRPLDMDDREPGDHDHDHVHRQLDDLPQAREGTLFSIDDLDKDTGDMYSQSPGTNDEYFYDEVYGKSVFEDGVTNASMRQLYLTADQEDDEMFDVDAIVSSITGVKSTTSKT